MRPGPAISTKVSFSPGTIKRAGAPLRAFAAVPPRPRSPRGFSQLIDRLSLQLAALWRWFALGALSVARLDNGWKISSNAHRTNRRRKDNCGRTASQEISSLNHLYYLP